jgi:hypothetical protein
MNVQGMDLPLNGDAISIDYSAGEIVRVKVEWM